jgi:peroxiredoxin
LLSDVTGEIAKIFGVFTNKGGTFTKIFGNQEIEIKRSYTPSRWTFILDNTAKIIYKDTEADFNNDNQKVIEFLQKPK